jgi:hypothetical protein
MTSCTLHLYYMALNIQTMEVNYRMTSCTLHLFITHSLTWMYTYIRVRYTWMYVIYKINVHIDKGSIHVNVCRNTSRTFPHSWLVARITRRVPLVEKKLLTIPEHMSSAPVFSVVRFTRSLVLCARFADHCLSFYTFFFWTLCCLFFFDIRIMVASLWYLQTLLIEYIKKS